MTKFKSKQIESLELSKITSTANNNQRFIRWNGTNYAPSDNPTKEFGIGLTGDGILLSNLNILTTASGLYSFNFSTSNIPVLNSEGTVLISKSNLGNIVQEANVFELDEKYIRSYSFEALEWSEWKKIATIDDNFFVRTGNGDNADPYDLSLKGSTSNTGTSKFYALDFRSVKSTSSISSGSVAFGENTDAMGSYSLAFGLNSKASNIFSFAGGFGSESNSAFSFAFGDHAIVNNGILSIGVAIVTDGNRSLSFGSNLTNSNENSILIGTQLQNTGANSILIGNNLINSSSSVISFGESNSVNGDNGVAIGTLNLSSGKYSNTLGYRNVNFGYSATVIGLFNDKILANAQTSVSSVTPLFIIGNGADDINRSNALVVYYDGRSLQSNRAEYSADFSASYTDRTLIDRGYLNSRGFLDKATADGFYSPLNHTHNNLKTVNSNLWNDVNDILYGDNFVFTSSVSYQKLNMYPSAWSTNAILSIGTYVDDGFAGTQIGVASLESSLFVRHKFYTWGSWAKIWTSENLTQASINSWNNAATFVSNFNANNYILNQDAGFQTGSRFWITYGYAEGLFKAPAVQFGTPDSGQARDMQIFGNYGDYTLDFTRSNNTIAQSIRVGGVFISNDYSAVAPANGLYVKGKVIIESLSANSIVITDPNKNLSSISGAVGQLLRRTTTGFEFFTPDYLTSSSLNGYATESWVTSNYIQGTRTITINGNTQDLSANRSWTISTHDALTLGVNQNGLSLSSQVLSLNLATTSNNGALSSTDWNTFNNKQNILNGTGLIVNSGTSQSYISGTSGQLVRRNIANTAYEFFTPNYVTQINNTNPNSSGLINIDFWRDELSYLYLKPESFHVPNAKGIDTGGGYASRTQVLTSTTETIEDDIEHVIKLEDVGVVNLTVPNANLFPHRIISITNRSTSDERIVFDGADIYWDKTVTVSQLKSADASRSFPVSFPENFYSITIKSVFEDWTGNYRWQIIVEI